MSSDVQAKWTNSDDAHCNSGDVGDPLLDEVLYRFYVVVGGALERLDPRRRGCIEAGRDVLDGRALSLGQRG